MNLIKKYQLAIILTLASLTAACSSIEPKQYSDTQPVLQMQEFFDGEVMGSGLVFNRSGELIRRFTVKMTGDWQENSGKVDEIITYDNGEIETRTWSFTDIDKHMFTAESSDAIGPATGQQYGATVQMKYTLVVKVDGETYNLNFDDWFYKISESHVINKSDFSKFGIHLGEVVIAFNKTGLTQNEDFIPRQGIH